MNRPEILLIETRTPAVTSGSLPFYFITFFIGLSYILITSEWNASVTAASSEMTGTMPGIIGIANIQSAAGKALLGVVGAALFLFPSPANRQYRVAPLFFFSGYLLVCFSSVIWSADTDLTIRRLLVLLIYLFGILGTVRHLSTRQVLDLAVVLSLIFITLGLAVELSYGTFNPLLNYYRFSGTMHPNHQGSVCAILVLSAYCGLRQAGSKRWIYLAALVIGVSFLFLTKSRSSILGCFIAVYLTSFWKTSFRTKQMLILTPLFFMCMTILIISLTAPNFLGRLDEVINIGRNLDTSDTLSLNGRVPLWVFLKDYILKKPILGYGYDAFWTPDMMASFGGSPITWAGSAHSVIIDLLLQVGLVGALLYVLSLLSVFYWLVKDCAAKGRRESIYTFALAIYAISFGLMESNFLIPQSIGAFVISVALFNSCIIKE